MATQPPKPAVPHVPRPQNPFILYRSWLKSIGAVPTAAELIKYRTVSKWAGEKWNAEDKEMKQKFYDRAEQEKRQHALMYPDYVYHPRQNVKRKGKGKEEESTGISDLKTRKGKRVKKGNGQDMPPVATLPVPLVPSSSEPAVKEVNMMFPPASSFALSVAQPSRTEYVAGKASDVQGAYPNHISEYSGGSSAQFFDYAPLDGNVVQNTLPTRTNGSGNAIPAPVLHDVVNSVDGPFVVEGAEDDLSASFSGEISPQINEPAGQDAHEDMFTGASGSTNFEFDANYPFFAYDWNAAPSGPTQDEGAADMFGVPSAGLNLFNNFPFQGLLPVNGL